MKKSFVKIGALACSCFLLAGCSKNLESHPELLEPVNANLEVALVEKGSLSSMKLLNGEVIPQIENISFEKDGYAYGIYVSAGEYVEEGDVVASMVGSNFDLISRLEDEIEKLEENNADLYKYLEAELELSRLNGSDTEELEIKLNHQKEMAILKLEQKRERLEELKADDEGYKYIVAPEDCLVVAASNARRGEFIKAGTPVAATEGLGKPVITCDFIPEKTVEELHEYYAIIHGERYELEYLPYTKEELKELSASGTTLLSRFNLVADEYENIQIGDYAAVITVADYKDNVLTVPVNAIYFDSTGKFVYEVKDNVRIKRNVQVGMSDSINTEIISGIEEGAYVYVKN